MSCVLSLLKQGRFTECWRPVLGRPMLKGKQNHQKKSSLSFWNSVTETPQKLKQSRNYCCISHKSPQLGGLASAAPNKLRREHMPLGGPIRAACRDRVKDQDCCCNTSHHFCSPRNNKKEKGMPLLFENTSPLSLASHWLELIYIDWRQGNVVLILGSQVSNFKKRKGNFIIKEKGEMDRK